MSETPVIRCRQLSRSFTQGTTQLHVLQGVDLDIGPGQRVAIIGASGVGKSTLLHLLGGLDQPSSGTVEVAGQMLSGIDERRRAAIRNHSLGFIYQFHHLLPEFTALENVAMPLLIRGQPAARAAAEASALLGRVGLGLRLHHKPGELSGGERQRAAVARALINQPACVLGDEPTGNLDEANAADVYDLMLELNRERNTSIVLVTHDRKLAARMDHCMEMSGGKLHSLP